MIYTIYYHALSRPKTTSTQYRTLLPLPLACVLCIASYILSCPNLSLLVSFYHLFLYRHGRKSSSLCLVSLSCAWSCLLVSYHHLVLPVSSCVSRLRSRVLIPSTCTSCLVVYSCLVVCLTR